MKNTKNKTTVKTVDLLDAGSFMGLMASYGDVPGAAVAGRKRLQNAPSQADAATVTHVAHSRVVAGQFDAAFRYVADAYSALTNDTNFFDLMAEAENGKMQKLAARPLNAAK